MIGVISCGDTNTPRPSPVDRESPFGIDELFFSTTDRTGKIRSGNQVFQRVAHYSLEEMLGQPHSLVRHPDMPRAAFYLLWQYLEAGRPVAAYVKNLAKDGSYYWVLAMVAPIPGEDGYLSVRLKPTSEVFPIVEDLYSKLREIEKDHEARGERPQGLETSAAQLMPALDSLGFRSYDQFMHHVLPLEIRQREERIRSGELGTAHSQAEGAKRTGDGTLATMMARCIEIRDKLDRQFAQIDDFIALSTKLEEKSRFVSQLSWSIRRLSINAMVASSSLGRAGATLGVISKDIGAHAEASKDLSKALTTHNSSAAAALREAAFTLGVAKLQMDMILVFVDELLSPEDGETALSSGEALVAQEGLHSLIACLTQATKQLFEGYEAVMGSLTPLGAQVDALYRLVQMLEITHLTGRVEAARIDGAGGFVDLFHQVGAQVQQARTQLLDFSSAVTKTKKEIGQLSELDGDILSSLEEVAGVSFATSHETEELDEAGSSEHNQETAYSDSPTEPDPEDESERAVA